MEKNNKDTEVFKFLKLDLENFKNIDKKVIEIQGRSFLIIGKNGAGKSSLIQALCSPLDTKWVPQKAVKKDEEKGQVHVTIGSDKRKYVLSLYFSEKNQKGRLVVENEKGEVQKTPATFIKSLLGEVSFDPMAWMTEKKEQRLKMWKKVTGCEDKLDAIKLQVKEDKDRKKFKKERVEELEAILKNNAFTQQEREKYASPVSIEAIQQELNLVTTNQSKWDNVKKKTDDFATEAQNCENNINQHYADIDSFKREIGRLTNLIATKEDYISKERISQEEKNSHVESGKAWLAKVSRPDSTEINTRMQEATKHNERHGQMSVLMEQQKEMLKIKQDMGAIDQAIKDGEQKYSDTISESQLPIKGLSFDDNDIYLDGIPLEDGGVNTAKMWEVCCDVSMAINPKLRIIFLHDASLFDRPTLNALIKRAEEKGFQVIAECVDHEGGELDIQFTEYELVK